MALIHCKECGAQISDKAQACPQCGAPVGKKAQATTRSGGTYEGIGFLIILISIFLAIGGQGGDWTWFGIFTGILGFAVFIVGRCK